MRKLVIVTVMLLIFTTISPSLLLASESVENRDIEVKEFDSGTVIDPNVQRSIDSSLEEQEISDIDVEKDTEVAETEKVLESEETEDKDSKLKVNKKSDQKEVQKEESKQKSNEIKNDKAKPKQEDPEVPKEGYNELGIKFGTMVHGEDISELSEEELQYIPEGWRDGVIESEHENETAAQRSLMRSSYPNVNNYIKNFKVANVEYDHKSVFAKFNYRNGFGRVEGVVAHETANNTSTIINEITYMTRNHKNAFVHAFVDHNRIIEIHPTDYGAWGAGRHANERFVHVELVRSHSFDHFARSINNYSDYIANILYQYNLGVSSAESSGTGSLWSHKAVSNFLGGTNHVDPHGYFAQWGYNWNDFVALVTLKHNDLIAGKNANTSKLGHIKSSNVRIYGSPTNLNSYSLAGSEHTNEVYYIKSEAKLNGKVYYLISNQPSSKSGVVGWVEGKDIDTHSHKGKDKERKDFIVKGSGQAYDKAWGGSKNLVYNLSSLAGEVFKVNLTETVGNNTWYRGTLKGKTVWIHSNYVASIVESKTSKLGHIRNGNVEIFGDIYDKSTAFQAGTQYTNVVHYIKREAKVNGDIFYLISTQASSSTGVVGWVNAKDMSIHAHKGIDKKKKSFIISGNGQAYNKAWGGSGDLAHQLSSYAGKRFEVNLTESVGNNVWYRGKLEGKTVWIHSNYVIDESKTSKLGHLKSSNVTIYSSLNYNGSTFKAGDQRTNAAYYIKKQAKVKGITYYLLSTNASSTKGVLGWAKASDLSTHSHVGVDKLSKTFYIKGTGRATSKAWGGSKDNIYPDLAKYKNQIFKVNLTEKVGNNTWYRGNLNGKVVWLHSNFVTTKSESNTSRLGHIRNGNVEIYKNIGDASPIKAGKTYTNTVYYIKKQAKLNGDTFYLISTQPSRTDGVIGWVNSTDLSSHPHVGVNKDKKTYSIKGTGSAFIRAWGGSMDLAYKDLSQFKGQSFSVNLTEKVGNNIWHRGTLQGKTVWIHSSFVN